jgi:hypothetical protein
MPSDPAAGPVLRIGGGWDQAAGRRLYGALLAGCPVSPRSDAYLTEPAVRPPTRCFSMTAKRITTGTIAISEAANSWSQFCS